MAFKGNFKVNGWSFKLCSSRKNSYLPHGRLSEDPQGKGVLQVKILEAKYEANLEFLGGGRGQNKKPSMGEVWIFSGTAHCKKLIKNKPHHM